jgi:MYXO-CTERM domain-containing protein
MADSDADGIPDSVDVDLTGGSDADGDGIDDSADSDFVNDTDTDGDGVVDSRDPDIDGDGFANFLRDGSQGLPVVAELPDEDGNGTPDVEDVTFGAAQSGGAIYTGLTGRGCSVATNRAGATDPTLWVLAIIAILALARRRNTQVRSNGVRTTL